MLDRIKKTASISTLFRFLLLIVSVIFLIILVQNHIPKIQNIGYQISNILNTKDDFNQTILPTLSTTEITQHILSFKNSTFNDHDKILETTIQCVGSLYNQSCLYKNLYYFKGLFTILTVKGRYLPPYSVRTDSVYAWQTAPHKREFDTYSDLEKFVRTVIQPKVIPSVTLHFSQLWHHNIGHALFDGLYPAYVALVRFPPRHLFPFRVLAGIDWDCNGCWSEDVYGRFGGLGILKAGVLHFLSGRRWFVFDELVMGSGTLCQRCVQPNFQLAGGVELDATRLFRDRMYRQHGIIPPVARHKSSMEGRTSHDILQAYIIDNKRYTLNDQKEINDAMKEINNYTYSYLNKTIDNTTKLERVLINVTYVYYGNFIAKIDDLDRVNPTKMDSRSPTYELVDNNFMAQLKFLHRTDIHIIGPGTGQMYQTFIPDGSVTINLGGIYPGNLKEGAEAYTSFMEQYMTSGAPYMKGLFYPINERTKGIKKEEVVKLIRQAGQLIIEGFSIPVNPLHNLAPDGQLFVELCEKDKEFCSLVTTRSPQADFSCVNMWVENVVHETHPWKLGGVNITGKNYGCRVNHTLLRELRIKYGIKHNGRIQ